MVQFTYGSSAADIVKSSQKAFSVIDDELLKKIEKHKELQKSAKNQSNKAQHFYDNFAGSYQAGYSGGPVRGKGNFYGHSFNPYTRFPFQQQQPVDVTTLANAQYFSGLNQNQRAAAPAMPPAGPSAARMSQIANLKQVTACARCGKMGHWHKDQRCLEQDIAAHSQAKLQQQFQQQAMSAFKMLPSPSNQGPPPPPPPPGTGMYTLNGCYLLESIL